MGCEWITVLPEVCTFTDTTFGFHPWNYIAQLAPWQFVSLPNQISNSLFNIEVNKNQSPDSDELPQYDGK